jgi:hypothetical protein
VSQATPKIPGDDGPTDCVNCGKRIRRFGQTRRWCHDETGKCAHCQRPVRGRAPAGPPLCRQELSVAWSGPECALLVEDWGHPAPCVDCAGLAGPELGWPGLVWLAARCGVGVDETMEAVTW